MSRFVRQGKNVLHLTFRSAGAGNRAVLVARYLAIGVITGFFVNALPVLAQNDLRDIPEPDPAAELAAMKADPLSSVNLFASDPEIRKPVQVNFDASGGLWVASSESYPQIEPGDKPNDKIVVLRDKDGDGVAESSQVFADGLLIPTGILPDGANAAYVAEGTQLLYLQDTDNDGRADKRQVVLSGFGTEDTHHLVHTLRWGPDGCVYFNQSIYIHSHIDTPDGTRHLDGGGIWRYRPTTGELEVVCKGFVNPWGHVFDATGESFVTDGAFFEGINYVFPDSVWVTSPGATRWLNGMNPGSPKHCGLEILSGTHIPPEWSGDLVTSDFRSHRVCRFTLKPSESTYISRQQPEIITTSHIAFRPIDGRMGPDGALYIADWYNPIIQHGEVDFRDERRDRKHGRIWRVSFPGRPLDPWPNFDAASIEELLTLLEDDSLAVRQFARQELWQRDADATTAAMTQWQQAATGEQNPQRVLERLWLADRLDRLPVDLAKLALSDAASSSETTLRTAIRSVWRQLKKMPIDDVDRQELTSLVLAKTTDPNPKVRLEAVVCCGQLDTLEAAKQAIAAAQLPMDASLDFSIWQTLSKLQTQWIEASNRGEISWDGKESALAFAVASVNSPAAALTIVSLMTPEKLSQPSADSLFTAAVNASDTSQLRQLLEAALAVESLDRRSSLLNLLLARTARDKAVPDSASQLVANQIQSVDDLVANEVWTRTIANASAAWKISQLEPMLIEAVPRLPESLRRELVLAIGALNSPDAKAAIEKFAASSDPQLQVAAIESLISLRPRAAIDPLMNLLKAGSPSESTLNVIDAIVKRKELPGLLAERLAGESLDVDSARLLVRRVRSAGGSESLEAALRKAGSLEDAAWKLTPELSQRILTRVKTEGSAEAGEAIYRRANLQCIQCHAIGPAGGLVGPNLISIGGSAQPDYILESLIDPSAKLKEGYTTLSVLTNEGKLFSGIVIGRDDTTLRLRLADATETQIAIDSIEEEAPGKSLMPAGMLDGLAESELVDLVAFLSELGRTPTYSLSTDPIVRSLETLVYTNESNRVLNRTSTDSVASDNDQMQWRLQTSKVDGTIPLTELDQFKQHREVPPTSFIRFKVDLTEPGSLGVVLPTEGIEAWVDGKPTPIWNLQSLQLDAGPHQVVLAIDRTKQTKDFAIKLSM